MPPDSSTQTGAVAAAPAEDNSSDAWFENARQVLLGGDDLRVWSVLVTIFGDLAERPGDRINGSCLTRLTGLMSIRPEAMRVALHRLRKDGWIDSEKEGRFSWYFLTETGSLESTIARKRIYARAVRTPDRYRLLTAQPMTQSQRAEADRRMQALGYVAIAPGQYLSSETQAESPEAHLVIDGTISGIPDWLKAELAPDTLSLGYRKLEKRLLSLSRILRDEPDLPALKTAALRCLLVHSWRRLLLRHPDLPDQFYPDTWRGPACRGLVMALLDQLERPDLALLAEY